MTPPEPPFIGLGWNDELEKHPQARKSITQGIFEVNLWLMEHAASVVPSVRLMTNAHRAVFVDVFPEFAGRIRGTKPADLPYDVEFGQFRGAPREDVETVLERLATNLVRLVQSLDSYFDTSEEGPPSDEVLKVAAYAHCELIRIHPFGNGNGRIARLLMNYITWRYLQLPIPIERPDTTRYLDANKAWLSGRDIEPMISVLKLVLAES